jgi:hypothetical protein
MLIPILDLTYCRRGDLNPTGFYSTRHPIFTSQKVLFAWGLQPVRTLTHPITARLKSINTIRTDLRGTGQSL